MTRPGEFGWSRDDLSFTVPVMTLAVVVSHAGFAGSCAHGERLPRSFARAIHHREMIDLLFIAHGALRPAVGS